VNKIVADASSLILLAKVGALEMVALRLRCLTSVQAFNEATVRRDFVDAVHILDLAKRGRIHVRKVGSGHARTFSAEWGLGLGESAALLLAIRFRECFVTDDLKAMQTARALGVPVSTSPLLIAAGVKSGWWVKKVGLAKLETLKEFFWVKPEIIDLVKDKLLKEGDHGVGS
jgi:predicted nucleic acid-binding protein